ncbi:MAG: hypothetical protein WAM52_10750, partial [Steroidobacteraceae bacterium]
MVVHDTRGGDGAQNLQRAQLRRGAARRDSGGHQWRRGNRWAARERVIDIDCRGIDRLLECVSHFEGPDIAGRIIAVAAAYYGIQSAEAAPARSMRCA